MKHIKLFESFVNEATKGSSIYVDALDAEISLGNELELFNGDTVKVLAIPDKSNPKFSKKIIIVSGKKGNVEINAEKDIKTIK